MTGGIIILEGPDASGKTTLAKFLRDEYHARYFHLTYRWRNKMDTYHTAAVRHAVRLASEGELVVLDRCWPSEAIYADVFRGGTPWPQAGRILDRVLLKHSALTIFCLPPSTQTAVERHAAHRDPDHPYDDKTFRGCVQRYLDMFWGNEDHTPLPVYTEGYGKNGLGTYNDLLTQWGGMHIRQDCIEYQIEDHGHDLVKFCNKALNLMYWLQNQNPTTALDHRRQNFSGHLTMAKYIVVGEKSNPKGKNPQWPFFELKYSSGYLNSCLHKLGLPEHELVMFNADGDLSCVQEMLEMRPQMETTPVVALGAVAEHYAEKIGFTRISGVYHPAYAARFMASQPERYLQSLRKAFTS